MGVGGEAFRVQLKMTVHQRLPSINPAASFILPPAGVVLRLLYTDRIET